MQPDNPVLDKVVKYIRESGHSITGARHDVIELLSAQAAHLTADQIYEKLGRYRLDRSSLYRVLDLLCDLRVLRKVPAGNRKPYYEISELFAEDHAHLICIKCKRLVTLPEAGDLKRRAAKRGPALGRKYKYKMLGNLLQFQGICPDCATGT